MLKRKRAGYYSGCCSNSKWPLARKKFKWDVFAELLPHQAAKMDEVPEWLKLRLCEDVKRQGPRKDTFPAELLQIADGVLMDEASRGLEMDTKSVNTLLTSLVEIYNEEAEEYNKAAEQKHLQHVSDLQASGSLSEEELEQLCKETPPQISLIAQNMTEKKMEHIVSRFCRTWGFSSYRQDRPSKHLSRAHPSMKAVSDYIKSLKDEKKINPRLMFNWDQVWTCILAFTLQIQKIEKSLFWAFHRQWG